MVRVQIPRNPLRMGFIIPRKVVKLLNEQCVVTTCAEIYAGVCYKIII